MEGSKCNEDEAIFLFDSAITRLNMPSWTVIYDQSSAPIEWRAYELCAYWCVCVCLCVCVCWSFAHAHLHAYTDLESTEL